MHCCIFGEKVIISLQFDEIAYSPLTMSTIMQHFYSRSLAHFPFLSGVLVMALLRITTAGLFMAHAIVRIVVGSIPQFGVAMESMGFPSGILWVWVITITEIVAGTLLIAGRYVRWATVPLLTIVIGGIILIHRKFGWFVGEHGTGGSEYSVALTIMLLVIAVADRDRNTAHSSTG